MSRISDEQVYEMITNIDNKGTMAGKIHFKLRFERRAIHKTQ